MLMQLCSISMLLHIFIFIILNGGVIILKLLVCNLLNHMSFIKH